RVDEAKQWAEPADWDKKKGVKYENPQQKGEK
ncbi:unnamed protein product, partial [marine sediment metagenome]